MHREHDRDREQLRNRVLANAKHQADADAFARTGSCVWDNRAASLHARLYWSDLAGLGFTGAVRAADNLACSLVHLGMNPELGFIGGSDPRSYTSQARRPQRPYTAARRAQGYAR